MGREDSRRPFGNHTERWWLQGHCAGSYLSRREGMDVTDRESFRSQAQGLSAGSKTGLPNALEHLHLKCVQFLKRMSRPFKEVLILHAHPAI